MGVFVLYGLPDSLVWTTIRPLYSKRNLSWIEIPDFPGLLREAGQTREGCFPAVPHRQGVS